MYLIRGIFRKSGFLHFNDGCHLMIPIIFFVGYDVYDKSEYRLSRTRLVDNQLPLVLYWNSLARPYGYCIENEGASPSFSSD